VLRRGPTRGRLAAIVLLCLASSFTHVRGTAILVPALFVGLWLLWRHRRPARGALAAVGAALAALTVGALYISVRYATGGDLSGAAIGHYASYLWRFYLPGAGFIDPMPGPPWGVRQVFIDRFFGTYGALDVLLPVHAISALKWLALIGIVLALIGLAFRWNTVRRRPEIVLLFVLSGVAYMYLNHVAAYQSLITSGDPVITGRYLLPFIAVYALAIGLALSWLPKRWAPVVAGVVTGGLCILSVLALSVTLERFYA
jgi:hypothetical protein